MKTNRLSLRTVAIGLIAVFVISACNSTTSTPKADLPAIRIGINVWVGNAPLYIAQAKGFFEQEGVKVELVNFDNPNGSSAAFASKQLEAVGTTLPDAVAQAAAKVPLQVVWVTDASNGADVVVGSSAISSPADLKGKRIGLSYGTFGHFFVLSGLAKYGLSRDDVTIIDVPSDKIPQAIADGKIDAGHTWEPYLGEVLKNGGHKLFTTADTPGAITDILQFQTQTIQKRPDDVKAVLRAMLRALDFWAKNPAEGNQIVSKAAGLPEADMPAMLEEDHIYSLAEVQAALDPDSPQSLHAMVATIGDFFVTEKIIQQAPDAQTVLNDSFAQSLADNN